MLGGQIVIGIVVVDGGFVLVGVYVVYGGEEGWIDLEFDFWVFVLNEVVEKIVNCCC